MFQQSRSVEFEAAYEIFRISPFEQLDTLNKNTGKASNGFDRINLFQSV